MLISVTDSVTKKEIISAKEAVLISGRFAVFAAYYDSTFALFFQNVEANECVDQNDVIRFVFSKNSQLDSHNMRENCESLYGLYFSEKLGNLDMLKELTERPMSDLVVYGKNKTISVKVSTQANGQIHQLLRCLDHNAGAAGFSNAQDKIYTIVDIMPMFPGGYSSMWEFVRKNFNYPSELRRAGISETVYVSFVVRRDGSITEVRRAFGKKNHPVLEAEAIRVVSIMPNWTPGLRNGFPINYRYVLPLRIPLR